MVRLKFLEKEVPKGKKLSEKKIPGNLEIG
jgi:hypothetical protein